MLGRSAIRDLAARYGIRPSKALGQNFLIDPNMARAIATDATVGPGDAVLEIGPGFGSLTVALAATGADVVAVEFDRALVPALEEVCRALPNVDVVQADALSADWAELMPPGSVTMVSNLPFNIAVPVLLRMFERAPRVTTYVVVIQRELGDRFTASVGDPAYGAVSVKIAYFAESATVRRVPPDVFWPAPSVGSIVVRLTRRPVPAVAVDRSALFTVIDAGFAERRKRMTNALRRLGLGGAAAEELMRSAELPEVARAEEVDVEGFGRVTAGLLDAGVVGGAG